MGKQKAQYAGEPAREVSFEEMIAAGFVPVAQNSGTVTFRSVHQAQANAHYRQVTFDSGMSHVALVSELAFLSSKPGHIAGGEFRADEAAAAREAAQAARELAQAKRLYPTAFAAASKIVEAQAWNDYNSDTGQQLPIQWRLATKDSFEDGQWIIVQPIQVVKSTESVSEYKFWRSVTLSGRIEISDQDFERILAAQNANGYHGPYRVDGDHPGYH